MRFRRPIYRILFYAAWVVVMGGIVTLLVAANSKARARTCKGIAVSINNDGDHIYVEKEDVLKNIEKTARGSLVNRRNGDINLAALEKNLETDPWVRDAELYFDTKDILHVSISERIPVARVFTTAGTSFYIDSAASQMPLLESYSAKLPVITGFPPVRRIDSALLQETRQVVQTISADPFWNAQVGQIDIAPDHKFELVPVVGSHVIKLGNGNNVAGKLARLMVFYKQVLPKAGLAKYSALDLQFDGQVVALRRGLTSTVDSLQLQKNIRELMEKKMAEQEPDDAAASAADGAPAKSGDVEEPLATNDTVATRPVAANEKPAASVKPAAAKPAFPLSNPSKKPTNSKAFPKKTIPPVSGPMKKPAAVKKATPSRPKAVMPQKAANDY